MGKWTALVCILFCVNVSVVGMSCWGIRLNHEEEQDILFCFYCRLCFFVGEGRS